MIQYLNPSIIFVGQAPNATAWEYNVQKYGEEQALRRGEILALTGGSGRRVASLLDMRDIAEFAFTFRRVNLNSKHIGKDGKGDHFDQAEGLRKANELRTLPEVTKYILLGKKVLSCFFPIGTTTYRPLTVYDQPGSKKQFFALPHPSGINTWYNNQDNMEAAGMQLKRFIYSGE